MIKTTPAQSGWIASMCTDAAMLAVVELVADHVDLGTFDLNEFETLARGRMLAVVADLLAKMGSPEIALQRIEHLESRTAVGYEAFARFGGGLGPAEAFRAAAAHDLAIDLELVALNAALARLDEIPLGSYLGVNLSPNAVLDARIYEALASADTSRLVVEITQQSEIVDVPEIRRQFRSLQSIGAVIAVDGAGVGFFRGQRLIELQPEVVKVDRSLISKCDSSDEQRAELKSLLAIGRRMGAFVIGTGVERPEELDILTSLGFDGAQGHLFGAPSTTPAQPAAAASLTV